MHGLWKAEILRGSSRWPARPTPWVARIDGTDPRWGFKREFVRGVHDYTYGEEHHSRGVWLYFFLPPGLYEVYRPVSWKHEERYFVRVDGQGNLHRIRRQDVITAFEEG